jgi:hypothetical protein
MQAKVFNSLVNMPKMGSVNVTILHAVTPVRIALVSKKKSFAFNCATD